ncbi:hypothetical protein EI42_05391 [Thermosporothrix hazakensis]|jgi:hypothetical protein|uniref:Uncharacterized protein n=1 Tax=Thermosporothrix hazakensis TaxID=644383 RepID=A0A326TYP7_THEHA|nr:hypothetical protein EI42_05391 [Thermosporothrix hazakensis]GCE50176.1 hypothetical protein KTH_50450 [Thermosporothrix hazakensis]
MFTFILLFLLLLIFVGSFGYMLYSYETELRAEKAIEAETAN